MMDSMGKVVVGLIRGRHEMPCTDFIFDSDVAPLDFDGMAKVIRAFIADKVGVSATYYGPADNIADFADCKVWTGDKDLIVYVTGLTAATTALCAECARSGVTLTLMHFDRDSGDYVPQHIWG